MQRLAGRQRRCGGVLCMTKGSDPKGNDWAYEGMRMRPRPHLASLMRGTRWRHLGALARETLKCDAGGWVDSPLLGRTCGYQTGGPLLGCVLRPIGSTSSCQQCEQ